VSGYRAYFGRDGDRLIVLLGGGTTIDFLNPMRKVAIPG